MAANVAPQHVASARYAICTALDETVLSTPWGSESVWSTHSLLTTFHQEAWGGEKFFQILDRLKTDVMANIDLLEVMYLCLSLGFEGKFKIQERGHVQIASVRDELYRLIRQARGEIERSLSPNWHGVEDRRNPLARYVPLWVVATVLITVLLGLFISFRFTLSRSTQPIDEVLSGVGVQDIASLNAVAVPNAIRLAPLLAGQESQGLINITEKGGITIVTLQGDNLFAHVIQLQTFETMHWLAHSNYGLKFADDRSISERVIFPVSENERNGIEDARFVRFTDDDGTVAYYATYTAYNGVQILPQLIKTRDFVNFRIITLNGKAVQDKGMALFPRRVDGKYVMISRQDGVNLHIMRSDHLHFWQESHIMQYPEMPWEFTQIGNCGSPIETEDGWLLLTHGVGPMRKYCIGVDLLDLHDPSRVIARLDQPILAPNGYEREGYVPNVIYTCGYMIHREQLIIPYAMSDSKCAIASLSVTELLERLRHEAA